MNTIQNATAPQRILIVGGGIAGLSLAIALCRQGKQVHIAELNAAWNVYGVGVILQSYALRALDSLQLAAACVEQGYPYSVSRHFDSQGQPLHERVKVNLLQGGWPASCGILRTNLHILLSQNALDAGAKVLLGTTVQTMDQDESGVDVMFSDGKRDRFDVVVGADGVRSQVRKMLFGADLQPRFTGQACWRFTLPRPAELTSAQMFHGQRKLAGLIPLTPDHMYLLLLTEEPGNPRMPEDRLDALLRERLAEFKGPIAAARECIPASDQIVYRPLESLMVDAPWSRGRIVLIGDAAHATTPHLALGVSLAAEDAVILAEMLKDASDVPATLEAFSKRRHARCKRVVDASGQIGEWQMRGEPASVSATLAKAVMDELAVPA